jgi:type I restriction enzyme S subunit
MAKQTLPIGWEYPKSRDVFASVTDKSHGGRLQVLSATQDRGIVPRTAMDIDIKFDENALPTYKRVVPGNFVIHLRSFQGGLAYSEVEGIISPAYVILEPKVPIADGYYKYLFQSKDYIKRLNVAVYGIRDGKQISYDSFGMINIPLPPLSEQRTIAEIITTADRLITVKERLITAKRKQKQWLMQNLLTGKLRLPGFSGEWESARLGDITDISTGEVPTTDEVGVYPFVNAGTNPSGYLSSYNTEANTLTTPSRGQGGIGSVCYQTSRFWCGPLAYRIRSRVDRALTHYLYYWLSNNVVKIVGLAHMSGLPALNQKELVGARIALPPLPEQQAIAAVLTTADREIELLTRELEQQRQVKKYLMQQLLTGRIRTKETNA